MYMTGKKYLSLEMFMTWLDMILGISKPKTHTFGCFQVIPVIFPYRIFLLKGYINVVH